MLNYNDSLLDSDNKVLWSNKVPQESIPSMDFFINKNQSDNRKNNQYKNLNDSQDHYRINRQIDYSDTKNFVNKSPTNNDKKSNKSATKSTINKIRDVDKNQTKKSKINNKLLIITI